MSAVTPQEHIDIITPLHSTQLARRQNSDSSLPPEKKTTVAPIGHWTPPKAPFFLHCQRFHLDLYISLLSLLSLSPSSIPRIPFFLCNNYPILSLFLPFIIIFFSMLGSLSVIATGTSLKFSPENIRSDRMKMLFSGKTSGRLTISAAVAEALPPSAVEGRRKPANFYEVLKVRHNASQIEIKTAYRALAKIYHPDVAASAAVVAKHPEESVDGRDFIEIHNAYATLSDPAAREIYDLTLRLGSPQRQPLDGSYSASGGYRRKAGYYTTRRWETDQCW